MARPITVVLKGAGLGIQVSWLVIVGGHAGQRVHRLRFHGVLAIARQSRDLVVVRRDGGSRL